MIHPAQLPMKVLIACEWTGTVRRAFDALGHDVWSCDILAAEDRSNRHIQDDVRNVLDWGWDLMIVAHPPCTRLCNSGVRWIDNPMLMKRPGSDFTDEERAAWPDMDFDERYALMQVKLQQGADLFSDLWNAPIDRVAVENPIMHKYAKARIRNYQPFAQSVQPWQFGDFEKKRTCFWLRGLEPLVPDFDTVVDAARALGLPDDAEPVDRVHKMAPGAARGVERSRFFAGIARAMARQWGGQALAAYGEAA